MFGTTMVRQSFKMSVQNIKSNKMRSFLTMLGIVIGVAAVIALITIVQSVTDKVMGQFSDLGAGTMSVEASGSAMKKGLTESDIAAIAAVDGIDGVSPSVSATTSVVYDGDIYKKVSVKGYNATYFEHNNIIASGRGFTEQDMSGSSMVCIVDSTFIKNILYGKEVLGQTVRIKGIDYTVVGVKKDADSIMDSYSDTSELDGTVIVPYKNSLSMAGAQNVTSLDVYLADNADSSTVEKRLRSEMNNIYNNADNSFYIINMESLLSSMNQIKGMMSGMLGGIASIALLVGGIGIMNMMLVSVSERTKEIGLRKALGAEPARIQAQFLIESIVLSVIGGLIGVGFGLIIAYIGSVFLNATFTISVGAIALGLGFSLIVGVVFGWAPARRASKLNPIDALRSD
ncbi:MAG: FtsX-like permease family protein [Clostridiales bacterium]|nr:FtsX-like permease family protein [Clostridiales bacterium]